jgi:hypothetical protein
MDTTLPVVSSGALAALLLEGIKQVIRLYKKDPAYSFPVKFYLFMLPVLNILFIPVMALLGVEGYAIPTDWTGYARLVVLTVIASLISITTNTLAINPTMDYKKSREIQG